MGAIPQFLGELKQARRWLLWRSEARNGKCTKVPYCARGGLASSTDPETWCRYEEAAAVVERYEGMGFAIGDGTVLIDLDGCRDPKTGAIQAWAVEIISLMNAPTEVSPSGTGVHIYVKSETARSVKRMFEHNPKRGIEVYPHGRFSTVTFNHLVDTPYELPYRDVALFVQRVERGDFDPEDFRDGRVNETCSRWERDAERPHARFGTSFDLDRWMAAHNVEVVKRKSDGIILIACPGSHGDYDRRDGRAFVKEQQDT